MEVSKAVHGILRAFERVSIVFLKKVSRVFFREFVSMGFRGVSWYFRGFQVVSGAF